MHELSIATEILETVRAEASRRAPAKILTVGLRLGELSGVEQDSLSFCFEALVQGSDLDPLALKIERTPGDELDLAWLEVDEPVNRVPLERKVLSENDRIAAELRASFERHNILCVNLISSPGSGKTTLLEKTLESFPAGKRVAVLTGDIQTDNDARRLARFGFPVRQITTAGACHLDARMVQRALEGWDLESLDLLLVENVGNLVCPASYDLGEAAKIVLLSVTEGEDKPLKYPATFFKARLLVLTKTDLLPYVPFSLALARENARTVQPNIEILELSCSAQSGMDPWFTWLNQAHATRKP